MISGQQAFFFLATWWAGYFFPSKCSAEYFFPLHFSAGFFFLKKVSCVYIYRMYLHLHCGYCCNSSIWSCKALKCCKLYKIMLYKNMFFLGGGDLFFLVVFNLGVLTHRLKRNFLL